VALAPLSFMQSFWAALCNRVPSARFTAATPADLEPLFAIEPPELLVVHGDTFPDVQAIAEAAHRRQFTQPGPNRRIVRPDATFPIQAGRGLR
jgi:hypothetical protein